MMWYTVAKVLDGKFELAQHREDLGGSEPSPGGCGSASLILCRPC